MDGHFVPNLTYGAPVIRDWRNVTDLPFDVHLMISEPGRYLDDFVAAGCDQIIVHIEVAPDPTDLLRRIRRAGCRAALSLNPSTPVESILPVPGGAGLRAGDERACPASAARASSRRCSGRSGPARSPARARSGDRRRHQPRDRRDSSHRRGHAARGRLGRVWRRRGNYAAALAELAEAARRGLDRGGAEGPCHPAPVARMTQVFLIRPGATVYDEQNRVQGVLDIP